MNPLLQTALAEAIRNGTRIDALADFDELTELNRLADRVLGASESKAYRAALRPSVEVGGATLYPITIGASQFLREQAANWIDDDDDLAGLAMAYVLAHGRTPERIWQHTGDRAGFIKAVRTWTRSIGATRAEIAKALVDLRAVETVNEAEQKRDAERATSTSEPDHGWLLELLTAEYGENPQYWLWTASLDTIDLLVTHRLARLEAETKQMSNAKGIATAPDPDSGYIRNLRAFRVAFADFEKRHAPSTKGPPQ